MFRKLFKQVQENLETLSSIGLAISVVGLILFCGGAIATYTYNSIRAAPYNQYLAIAVFLFFTSIVFSIFKIIGSEIRRKNIWKETEEKIIPEAAESKTAYLIRRVTFSVKEFNDSTKWLFRSVRIYKYSTVGLSVISTVVLGLNFEYLNEQNKLLYSITSKNIALVLNTLIAAISTLSIFWNIEKYWIQNKVIKHQLKRLKTDIEFEMSNRDNEIHDLDVLNSFFVRHQSILKDFHFYWEGVLTEKNDAKK